VRRYALPGIFLATWGSGFIACKAGLYHADPLTFLFLRFSVSAALLWVLAVALRAPWPRTVAQYGHLFVAGILIQATYLGPNFTAAANGFPVGVTALIGALQPILTAMVASRFFAEKVSGWQWVGLAIGLVGIVMVLSDKLAFDWGKPFELLLVGVGILSLTLGTLYQKYFCGWMDLRSGAVVQAVAATTVVGVGALLFESGRVDWTPAFMLSLGWLIVLSIVTYTLMHILFMRGDASRVASMFYLVPPFTSTVLYFFFDENLGWLAVAGIAVTVVGVALAARQQKASPDHPL
jgi:drug/metabolite transporter (DMT)-like permease